MHSGRHAAQLGSFDFELGGRLSSVELVYETWGTPRHGADATIDNAVLVHHALTGDAHVQGGTGPGQPTPGWWDGVVGAGRALDTDRWFVVAANVLGGCRGSTGPATRDADGRRLGSRFPEVTIRDQVRAEAALADRLGIGSFAAVLGGSMGGMRSLEWTLMYPRRVRAGLVLAVGAVATGDQIGTQTTQQSAITSDPAWRGGDYDGDGPTRGLALARRIAHLSYRSELELDSRFGNRLQPDGDFAADSYLAHHGAKLVSRFDAGSYVTLTQAMNTHDVGRGRGGVPAALATIRTPLVVAGISSDRLYPLRTQQQLVDLTPGADGLHVVHSEHGHDGFLIESEQVGRLIEKTLAHATAVRPA